ncbi:14743_t:CDS:2, partial [Racocetra fulgida]
KWLTFKEEEINNFYLFKSDLNNYIRRCLDLRFIYNNDYEKTYKVNGRGQAIHIPKESDLNEDEYSQAQVILELRNKYKCSQHVTHV